MALDKSEGVVKAQKSRAVFFTALLFRVVENRSSETLTVNQLSAALTPKCFLQGLKPIFIGTATWGLKPPPPKEAIQRQDAAFGLGALKRRPYNSEKLTSIDGGDFFPGDGSARSPGSLRFSYLHLLLFS